MKTPKRCRLRRQAYRSLPRTSTRRTCHVYTDMTRRSPGSLLEKREAPLLGKPLGASVGRSEPFVRVRHRTHGMHLGIFELVQPRAGSDR